MPLRHVDPHVEHGPAYRAYARLMGSPAGAWLSRRFFAKLDPYLLRFTRGRVGLGLAVPTVALETRGARTGSVRRNAVIYLHDGDRVIIAASNAGRPTHPAWYHNLRANPEVRLADKPFHAETVTEAEARDRLWLLADRVFPPYANYRRRAARTGRTIPLVQLTPTD